MIIKKLNGTVIGKPIFNSKIYILDFRENLCPVGVVGELCIAGQQVARGYFNRAKLTAEKFTNSPFIPGERMYKTGDLARWMPDGNIEFLGRKDNQIQLRGYRIELGEVESILRQQEAIDSAAILMKKMADGEQEMVAYFISSKKQNVATLKRQMGMILPKYMIPAYFVQMDEFPMSSNSKIDRSKFPDPISVPFDLGIEHVAAESETEKMLVNIWREVLGIKKIGVEDNFFDIGGNSIKILKVVGLIDKAFDIKVPVVDIYKYPNIKALAKNINSNMKEALVEIDAEIDSSVDIMHNTINLLNSSNDE